MTPKEKAKDLVEKIINTFYKTQDFVWKSTAKQCALIAVDEILNEFPNGFNSNFEMKRKLYWEEVKEEIENL